ncbi:dolichyl-phosphate beta-glucosyltransferase [Rudaeicoccus suwonensis]|uniref:dolichyl-phosphate beta-glucosyltransferase n=1 Tax=Rudaeicoccus suwonensis TaxID=657409 RepID=A0A561E3H2_9MICO|nr:glycosyl transferase family 2 [Rudaeicoccus suwonensis]
MTTYLPDVAASERNSFSMTTTVLDLVIPVYNEERILAESVGTVHAYLTEHFAYPFRITIADNASTDMTLAVALRVARSYPGVRVVHLDAKGRGRALKAVWRSSDALVLAYLDVDLSTDLDALAPLVAPLMSGHSDLAIGSRLAHGAHIVRGRKRDLISRTYNRILRLALGVEFTDAQCGFKAIRADVARDLLPLVKDDTWFFDTELLVLAERADLRIHEVPVDWYDDPDSRVDVVATAKDDLRGVWRMCTTRRRSTYELSTLRATMGRGRVLVGPHD